MDGLGAVVLIGLGFCARDVLSHGIVTGIVADGVYYQGYSPSMQYMQTAPKVIGWSAPQTQSHGPVAPNQFNTPDMICHLGATNAPVAAKVTAGSNVTIQWTAWPESHHGPVMDYLAACNGDCGTVDKTKLSFFKIYHMGLIDGSNPPGIWADDLMIKNNNSWAVTIPATIAPGQYVLRHETIALHAAGREGGAQAYPQCINLDVQSQGTEKPQGILGTQLYTSTDPGIVYNIYQPNTDYPIPGPPLYKGPAA